MGTEAIEPEDTELLDEPQVLDDEPEPDDDEPNEPDDQPEPDDEPNPDDDDGEDVVLHADDADTAKTEEAQKPKGPGRRARKLLQRIEQVQSELTGKDEENQLLRMQLETLSKKQQQDTQRPKPPTLADAGYDEAVHADAMIKWAAENALPSVVTQQLTENEKKQQAAHQKQARENALESHYQRADNLKVSDYDAAEDKATAVLGRDLVADIAATAEDSHLVLYYLGKNPAKAEELKRIFDEKGPALGTYELGKIAAGLKVTSAPKKSTPDPDKPVDGAGPSGGTWQQRLEKARAKADKTGDLTDVVRLKKEARAAGVNL